MAQITIEAGTVADAYLALLADRSIEYLFANAGTDFAPLIEAMAKAEALGKPFPRPVTVPHENVAVAMAQGYYLGTGRPALVMVHVNVGTANAVCGLLNAWRGNIPVLFTAGRTPFSEDGDLTGKRSGEIHWPQEMRDQNAMVREMVKWDYQLPNAAVLEAAVDRALDIAMSEPRGPVYLTLPREVLAAPVENFRFASPARRRAATAPFPDIAAVDTAAEMIARAERPVIVTASAGRDGADVAHLGALANLFAIPVVQRKPRYMCLPSDHPMHLGYDPDTEIRDADLVLVVECDVPWIPGRVAPPASARIVHLGVDPLFASYPMRGFPCDLGITGVLGATLPLLTEALIGRLTGARDRIEARRARVRERHGAMRDAWAASLRKAETARPLHPAWITHCLDQVRSGRDIVVRESPLMPEYLRLSEPGTYFFTGAAGGLGYGLGTALGLKAAAPDRTVICTVGDGAYMFGNPLPAHYVAAAENLPILTVVFNNGMWGAVKRNTHEVYPTGYASRSNREPLTYFDVPMAFEKAVQVVDGYGEAVTEPAALPAAIERAMTAVTRDRRQALLNVTCRGV